MDIIAVHGPMYSGKDSACAALARVCEDSGLTFRRVGFADALKVSAARSLGCPVEWTVDQCVDFCNELKEGGDIQVTFTHVEEHPEVPGGASELWHEPAGPPITGRQFLQWYGTEAHRDVFGENFWVDALLPLPWAPPDPFISRTEVDRQNEVILARKFPGVDVLGISDCRFVSEATRVLDLGGSVVRISRPDTGGGSHASEAGLPDHLVTHTLNNGGTLDDLQDSVAALARNLGLA